MTGGAVPLGERSLSVGGNPRDAPTRVLISYASVRAAPGVFVWVRKRRARRGAVRSAPMDAASVRALEPGMIGDQI